MATTPGYVGYAGGPEDLPPPYPGPLLRAYGMNVLPAQPVEIIANFIYDGPAFFTAWCNRFPAGVPHDDGCRVFLVATESIGPVGSSGQSGAQVAQNEWLIDEIRADTPSSQGPRVVYLPPVLVKVRLFGPGSSDAAYDVALIPLYRYRPDGTVVARPTSEGG